MTTEMLFIPSALNTGADLLMRLKYIATGYDWGVSDDYNLDETRAM